MRCRVRRAFTLIELLVVVAIIALLISILLPSLQRARAQSRMVKCLAQLREYANATYYYLSDNEDTFMPHREGDPSVGDMKEWQWYDKLNLYIVGHETSPILDDEENMRAYDLARCPDIPKEEWGSNNQYVGYGYNAFFLGVSGWCDLSASAAERQRRDWNPNCDGPAWVKSGMVKNSSECLLFGDTIGTNGGTDMFASTLWYECISMFNEGVWTRHCVQTNSPTDRYYYPLKPPGHGDDRCPPYPGGLGMTAYVDGHGEKMRSPQINRMIDARRYWDPFQRTGGVSSPDETEFDGTTASGTR